MGLFETLPSAALYRLGSPGGGSSIAAVRQKALPPFDRDDEYGAVHTVLPPEQVIPPRFTDPVFMRADFNGVTLDLARWNPKAPEPLQYIPGANSTPLAMLMTPMAPLYPRYWQDAILTEHAERGYDDFIVAPLVWNAEENGRSFSADDIIDWCRYVKSWGFRTVIWRGGRPPDDIAKDALIAALFEADVVSFYIHGKEVDTQGYGHAEEYEASIAAADRYIGGRIPIGAHFSANAERGHGYPIGAPREYFLPNWAPYDGRVHLCQQLCSYMPENNGGPKAGLCSAALQGAAMYYGRKHVNAARGDAAIVAGGAPNSRVIAFETMATAQLYGDCTEEQGCLRSWELLCGTREDARCRPVSGSGNGLRQPDGSPL